MNAKTVTFKRLKSVGVITLHTPRAKSNIAAQMAEEMAQICHTIRTDDTIRVVLVTGDGQKAFSTGLAPEQFKNKAVTLPSIAGPVAELTCPTIAVINGDAIGQGLELALACDIRIAADKAHFCIPHITSGLIPWDGATQRLLRTVGFTKAMEMVLTGEIIDAAEALRIGLVSKVVSSGELIPTAEEMARTMALRSPLALQFAKEAVTKGMDLTLAQGLRLEGDLYFLLQTTEDRTEGIKAFREKRPPTFKGK